MESSPILILSMVEHLCNVVMLKVKYPRAETVIHKGEFDMP